MFKYIIIFIIFFSSIFSTYALRVQEPINEKKINYRKVDRIIEKKIKYKNNVVDEVKNDFEIKKQELIKEYKDGKITLKKAKEKLLKEKEKYIESGKKKLEEEREEKNNEKLEKLRTQVKSKIDKKIEKYSGLESDKKNIIYEKVLSKIDKSLENKNISSKQKLLYSILKDIFSDLIVK